MILTFVMEVNCSVSMAMVKPWWKIRNGRIYYHCHGYYHGNEINVILLPSPRYYLQMIWRNVVSNSCTFFSDYNLLWSLAFCQSAKAAVIYVTSLHVWNVLVRFVVKSTETDLQIYTMVWYTYYSIVRVLPTVQVAANETYIPFAILCLEREGKMLSLWKK